MEVIMSSSVQDHSGMENDRGDGVGKLSKSQKKRKRKSRVSLESFDKREDTGNPESRLEVSSRDVDIITRSSIQDSPNTGLGIPATVDQKSAVSSTAATGDGKSLIPKREGYREIAKGERGSSRTTTIDVKTGSKREEYMEIANDMRGSSRNTTLDAKTLSKREEQMEIADGEMGCSSAIGTCDAKSTVSKREQHMKIANGETVSSGTAIIDANSGSKREEYMETACGEMVSGKIAALDSKTVSKGEEHAKVANGDLSSSTATNLNVEGTVQKEKKQRSRREKPTFGEILNPRHLEDMETAIGEMGSGTTATDNTPSNKTKRKKLKNKNPASGDILSAHESTQDMVIAKKGSSTTKVLEGVSGEMVSGKIATPDAKKMSKGEEHTKVANGELGSSTTTNLNVEGTVQKEKKQRSRREKPTFGEILNPRRLEDMETAIGETGSGTTATDNTASNKRKRKELMNKNPASGDILSTHESTQDMVIAKKGSSTTKVLEAVSGEAVSGKIATPDAKTVSKGEEHTKVANGELGSSTTTNLNVEGTVQKEKKQKSRKRKPTLGEILNPRYLQDMETANAETGSGTTATDTTLSKKRKKQKSKNKKSASGDILSTGESTQDTVIAKKGSGTTATDTTSSKKRKRQKSKNKKPASGDILSIGESTQDTVIAKKGSGTTKVLQAMSTESKREDYPKIVHGEKFPRTTALDAESTMLKHAGCTEVANSEMGSSRTTTIDENTGSTGIATLDVKTVSKREEHTKIANGESGLRTTATCDAKSVVLEREWHTKIVGGETASSRKVEECTKVGNVEMGSSTIATLIVKNTEPENRKLKKRKKPTIGDILNPRYLEDLEIAEANGEISKKTKQQRSKKKRAMGLNTHENTEVKAIDKITHVATLGKKLLIFDVNGLLADIVSPRPKDYIADKYIPKRAIFKRPFLEDFLCFCFERFNVGIWSSRTKKILHPVVNYLLGDLKKKLLFLWDASSCTNTGIKTLEDKHKPIVFKDLRKIWEKNGPSDSWVKGTFDESNTLLLDDSPYKALLNSKHTGVFPVSYSYKNRNDDFLGPKGDLRIYLEGLAATDNVKLYVEQHPFGKKAIDETSPHWAFYSRVLKGQK